MPEQTFEFRGGALDLMRSQDKEVLICGPAGSGKSIAMLTKLFLRCLLVPGIKAGILRQTQTSLTSTTLTSFEQQVAVQALATGEVTWFGGSARKPAAYEFRNNSRIIVGGLDSPGKLLSGEVDVWAVDEANQISISAYETLLTRMRGHAPTYKQIMMACNPDHPEHWLKLREAEGKLRIITSLHSDNPGLVRADGSFTPVGESYLATLRALTGTRRARYYEGLWQGSEGLVYQDAWSDHRNLIDPFPVPEDWRVVWTVDFGYSNSFVWQQWRIDGDGRAYLTHEIARRQRLVEDHARDILELMQANGWKHPEAIVCDHDSEDRATLERHLKMPTTPARKAVSRGVQLTEARMRPAGDGKPRLLVFRNALIRNDPLAATDKRPRGFSAEINGYVWATERGDDGRPKEAPLKLNDHSMDAGRYLVMYLDDLPDSKMGNPARPGTSAPSQGGKWSRPVGR